MSEEIKQGRYPALTKDFILSRLRVNVRKGKAVWINPPNNHPRMLGKEAGHARKDGSEKRYHVIKFDKQAYRRAQIVLFLKSGVWPTVVDHKNGNSLDDRAANLRFATRMENARNRKIGKRGRDLPMGVRRVLNAYQARINVNKKLLNIGSFKTVSEAHRAYKKARKIYFMEFA